MRVLFLTHRLPFAPNRGDRIRAYHILQHLRGIADVDLVSLVHDEEERAAVPIAGGLCDSVAAAALDRWRLSGVPRCLVAGTPLTHQLLRSADVDDAIARLARMTPPDVVLAYCTGMAPYAFSPVLNGTPVVLDMVDVDSEKWRQLAQDTAAPKRWIYAHEAAALRRYETEAVRRAVTTLVVNERERDVLLREAPGSAIQVVPNGVDVEAFRPADPPAASKRIVFTGVFSYAPNIAGALWLAREVWPRIVAAEPDAELWLVGSNPDPAVRALASSPGVHVTGAVPDVRPYLWGAAVAAAPLSLARGVQNKVLEALAAGLPCVVTPAVGAGLPAEATPGVLERENPADFADAVVGLLRRSPDERRRHADAACLAPLSWENRLRDLPEILRAATRRQILVP